MYAIYIKYYILLITKKSKSHIEIEIFAFCGMGRCGHFPHYTPLENAWGVGNCKAWSSLWLGSNITKCLYFCISV